MEVTQGATDVKISYKELHHLNRLFRRINLFTGFATFSFCKESSDELYDERDCLVNHWKFNIRNLYIKYNVDPNTYSIDRNTGEFKLKHESSTN